MRRTTCTGRPRAPARSTRSSKSSAAKLRDCCSSRQLRSNLGWPDISRAFACWIRIAFTTSNAFLKEDEHYRDVARQAEKLEEGPKLDALLDRHGTGRVRFRNTRATVSGFPERVVQMHPLARSPSKPVDARILLADRTPALPRSGEGLADLPHARRPSPSSRPPCAGAFASRWPFSMKA